MHASHSHTRTPASDLSRPSRRIRRSRAGRAAAAAAAAALASAGLAGSALAAPPAQPTTYNYATVVNNGDATFNQLLGINRHGQIAGYFGSGAQGHANKGYLTYRFDTNRFLSENFPGSAQTQVTGLNDHGVTVGFWSDQNNADQVNDNFGFVSYRGYFRNVNFPTTDMATPPVNQLLGVNDSDVAVGFYTDSMGNNHGYTYDIRSGHFHLVRVPGATNSTAAAINNFGDIAGFYTDPSGNTVGYLLGRYGSFTPLAYPGATITQATGVNDHLEVVGFYQMGSGDSATTYGFTWTPAGGFQSVTDPSGQGSTIVNGVNDAGDLVGFYTDAAGNVDGLLATPQVAQP